MPSLICAKFSERIRPEKLVLSSPDSVVCARRYVFKLLYLKDFFVTDVKTNVNGSGNVLLTYLPYALLAAILAIIGLYAVFVTGPAMRAAARENVARAIADEDHQFCEKFARRSGEAFAACSRELSVVRQRQTDRDNAVAQGIL